MNYKTTFTYPSEVMMPRGGVVVSSRSRIDSETSGSSESSRGSGRRRSHRPRGCRGGSNRRRNNSGDKGGKRNNNGPNNNRSNNNVVVVVNNENIRKLDNFKSCNSNEVKQPHQQGNPLQNISILSRKYEQQDSQKYTTSVMPRGRADEFALPGENYDDHMTDSSFHNSHLLDYPPSLQPSFSDSSSEGVALEASIFPRPNEPHQMMVRDRADGNFILPPLPPDAFCSEPIPSGPNPYALKLNNQNRHQGYTSQQGQHQQYHGSGSMESYSHDTCGNNSDMSLNGHRSYQPAHQMHAVNNSLSASSTTMMYPTINTSYDYKAERIEKQRQNVVGGSLFATSPRSFLFGLKKQTTV